MTCRFATHEVEARRDGAATFPHELSATFTQSRPPGSAQSVTSTGTPRREARPNGTG
jgi:hypothetical protein